MTAAKKSVTKKSHAKKSSKSKAKKKPARKAPSTKKKAAKKKSVKTTTSRKASKKTSASTKKKAAKPSSTKKASTKKASTKKASTKKSSAKSKATRKVSSKKATARKKSTGKKPAAKRTKTKEQSVAPVESGTLGLLEQMESAMDSDLLENFEGWETPSETSSTEAVGSTAKAGSRAEREADFDELLGDEKPLEDWSSTSVFESDAGVEKTLDETAEQNVAVTSLVVVPESSLKLVKECRIDQPDPEKESDFEEFAAEEIISILDESLALDLEAAASQVEPKDKTPQLVKSADAPRVLADEVAVAKPSMRSSQSGFLSRLWRMLISSDSD